MEEWRRVANGQNCYYGSCLHRGNMIFVAAPEASVEVTMMPVALTFREGQENRNNVSILHAPAKENQGRLRTSSTTLLISQI
jgi:hypothetical protein